jgi:PadR family transcriptional regulator PadR
MKLLSSHDEMLLLAILSLGDNAYGLTIRKEVSRATGKDWSIGAIYDPLYRLEKKRYVESSLTEPTAERGGRSKRIFRITTQGTRALRKQKAARDNLWRKIPETTLNKS